MARTFKQLEKEKSLAELNRFAKEVTESYATSVAEYSQTNTAMDNNLTKKGLRDLMDYAIKTAIVSLEMATLVLNKSIENQQRKAQEAGGSSINHHKDLIKVRVEFLASGYSAADINKIATDIANDDAKEISYFTRKYEIESDKITRKLLERAIVENIVSDEIVEKIIKRSLKLSQSQRAVGYFEHLIAIRKQKKKYFESLKAQRKQNKEDSQ